MIGGLAELLDLESILTFFYGIYYTVPLGLILGVLFFSVTGLLLYWLKFIGFIRIWLKAKKSSRKIGLKNFLKN